MSKDRDFKVRPGRIRSRASQRMRPFIAQALAAATRAGGSHGRGNGFGSSSSSNFGRGRTANVVANRLIKRRSRVAVVKARVVRNGGSGARASRHLDYLRREGVTRDDDTLPEKYFDEGLPLKEYAGHRIDREEFEKMKTRYYRLRGWSDEGVPPQTRMEEIEGFLAAV